MLPGKSLNQHHHATAERKDDCPKNGDCLLNSVIYKYTVSPKTKTRLLAYLGLEEGVRKQQYYNHMQSFRNAGHMNNTALSSYLMKLKKKTSEIPKLTLAILNIVPGY